MWKMQECDDHSLWGIAWIGPQGAVFGPGKQSSLHQ